MLLFFDVFQFTIPEDGITAGQAFGLGPGSPFEDNWEVVGDETEKPFKLSTEGDQVFIYCLDADNVPNFLWGYSYNGPWADAGLSADEYGEGKSALPDSLEVLGNLAVDHADNCVFRGDLAGRKTALQAQFMDPAEFTCLNDQRIELASNVPRGASSARSVVSTVVTGAIALAGAVVALML